MVPSLEGARRLDQPEVLRRIRPCVAHFSQSHIVNDPLVFVGINCAGEVRISEHQDFEKWAIHIMVKFRDSEKLQPLTAQRQSGGVSNHLD